MHSPCARHSSRGKMDLYLKIVYRLPDKNTNKGFPDSSVGKESACNAEDPGSVPGSGRSLKSLLNLSHYCFCFTFYFFGHKAHGILALQPGIEPVSPALEGKFLTPGPPEKSPNSLS